MRLRPPFSPPLQPFGYEGSKLLPRALRSLRDGMLGLAYPAECRLCGAAVESWDDGVACAACWNDPLLTSILTGTICTKCGAPLARATSSPGRSRPPKGTACGLCNAAPFTAARACGVYAGAFEASILSLKTSPHICNRLRDIIYRIYSRYEDLLRSEIVMPIPLHRLRARQRGFNQAAVIARLISRQFGLRFDDRSCMRIKPTKRHRAGMDSNDRAQSVKGAFEVTRPGIIESVSVLLVDDVYTTGSTISAASQALFDAGASRVNVLTIARVNLR